MTRKTLCLLIGGAVLALVIAACGTAATPEWAAAAQGTRVALASTSEHETAIAPTLTPTTAPTETPTTIPPTAAATAEVTSAATVEATAAATVEATAVATVETTSEATTAATAQAAAGDDSDAAIAAALKAGNPEHGQVLFTTMQAAAGFACATCHSVTADEARIIGPGLFNVSERAKTRVPGMNAVEYIHTSIVDPQAYVVQGDPPFPENLMPKIFSQIFSEQDIKDIIAYLLTLHN